MRTWKAFAGAVALAAMAGAGRADVVANWTFEVSDPPTITSTTNGPFVAEGGAGTATGVHADAVNGGWSSPSGNGSANSWNGNGWTIGDYFQFQVSTIGFQDVSLTWHQTRSSTGPDTWDLQYATSESGPFATFDDNYNVPQVTWSGTSTLGTSYTADLSAIAAVEDAPTLFFRLVVGSAPGSSGGASRVDNVIVSATPLPEPSGLLLLGLVLVRLARRS